MNSVFQSLLLIVTISYCAYSSIADAQKLNKLASKEELYEGPEFKKAFANPEDQAGLPRVLLIGDSISIGYTVDVRKLLAGKANVHRIPGNAQTASYGSDMLPDWLGDKKWDVIHFNWGLWDLAYRNPDAKTQGKRDKIKGKISATPEQYRISLEKNLALLKQTGAKLIWCATTPVPEGEIGRHAGDAVKYNKVAAEVMNKHDVIINDLHAHASLKLPQIFVRPGDVHFTQEGSAYLAEKVATEILKILEQEQ